LNTASLFAAGLLPNVAGSGFMHMGARDIAGPSTSALRAYAQGERVICNPQSAIRNPGFGIRDSGFGIRDSGFGIRNSEFATWDLASPSTPFVLSVGA